MERGIHGTASEPGPADGPGSSRQPRSRASADRGIIDRAVADGLERWSRARLAASLLADATEPDPRAGAAPEAQRRPEVVAPLPRRRQLESGSAYAGPSMRSQVVFKASFPRAVGRLFVWFFAAFLYAGASAADWLRRRASPRQRAIRLRRTLERVGGTFLKLGQQMSTRIDLLPMEYCMELSKLLDRVPPFSLDYAIETVERVTGKPLGETFSAFDPEPIGSASVACVYQAVLKNGDKVAVKVRRPGIVQTFAADWRSLSWIVGFLEFLTLIRPALLRNFLRDLATMFLEELDFRKEARHTDLFRRRAKGSRLRFISAPRVHFDLSDQEVLVTEFVSGVWLWELLQAVESRDQAALAYIRSLDIEPVVVARRLFQASLFGIFENLIFHADPHPANVVIRRDSEIVLIDFGSCGSYSESQLNIIRQMHYCQANEDVGGMVECVLALLEPLPPVDVDEVAREIEEVFSDSIRAIKSRNSEWWERTSAGIWIGFMRLVRRYHIHVDLDTLRMIRSTLLYDTLAVRLDHDLDIYREYRRYRKQMAVAARRRFRKRVRRLLAEGPDDRAFLRWEELLDIGTRFTYRLHRFLDSPSYKFSFLAGKAVFAVSSVLRWAWVSAVVGTLGVAGLAGWRLAAGEEIQIAGLLTEVAGSGWFLGTIGVLLLVNVRRVLFRFSDMEV